MKSKDIFIRTMAEVSGKPESDAAAMFAIFCAAHPEVVENFEREIPDDEAQRMLADFRAEAPGILAWLEEGARRVEARQTKTVH